MVLGNSKRHVLLVSFLGNCFSAGCGVLHCGPDLQNFMPRYGCHECDSDTEAISFSEWGLPAALRVCSRRTAARSTATMGLDAAGAAEAEVVGGVAEAPAAGAVEVAQGSAE